MKRLLILRHAKSDWHAGVSSDHERPLNARGERAARVVGRFLAKAGQVPELALTSTARRARTTLELAAEAGSWALPIEARDDLYETHPLHVLEVLRAMPDSFDSLLLVGHEPTSSALAERLIAGGQSKPGCLRFVTAAMARIDLHVPSWSAVDDGVGELVWMVHPKLFTEGHFGFASKKS